MAFVCKCAYYQGSYRVLNSRKSLEICPAIFQTWKKIPENRDKAKTSALKVNFFSCWSNLVQSRLYICSASLKKLCSCVFLRSLLINYLITLSLEEVSNFVSKNLYEPCITQIVDQFIRGASVWYERPSKYTTLKIMMVFFGKACPK